ncbi:unnamed protein product, partial [Ascophyllum nodosum]
HCQAPVGITALLATLSPCIGQSVNELADLQTQPLLSGSVCRVRDTLDFLSPTERAKVTFKKRIGIAVGEFAVGPTCHLNNGDEANVPNFDGQFHKSLPHDNVGRVDPEAYQLLLDCIESNDINVCDQVPSGADSNGRKLVNPLGGGGHQVDGADSDNIFIKQPDNLLSERLAAQQIEVYWMALVRDTPFSQYGTENFVMRAAENIQNLDAFNGLSISRDANGNIDPMQDLFRTDWPGVSSGPLVSQFMLADFDIDGIVVTPKAKTLVPNVEYMTGVDTWLNVQNGGPEETTQFVDEPLFIRNGRDLAALAFNDVLYTEAFRTVLILFDLGLLSPAGPYLDSARQEGFTTFGASHIVHAMAAASSSTRHAWYAKWQTHRVLRPEAYGGLVHFVRANEIDVPLPSSIIDNTELLNFVEILNQAQNGGTNQVFLLPMAVGEGSPVHPAYPSGHAVNLGGYITVLKAFLGFELGQRCFPNPEISNDAGTERIPYESSPSDRLGNCVNADGDEEVGLTIEGELNKVTANVALGRSHLGVHWRMDGVFGVEMGEAGAIRRLQQELGGLPEARDTEGSIVPASYKFRLYSGIMIELFPGNLYQLGDQMCEGFFTGDDFCVVSVE